MKKVLQDLEYSRFDDPESATPAVRTILSGALNVQWDYLTITYPTTITEVYTFKTDGSSGDVVRVITITYTDTTKDFISTVERSA